MFDSTFNLTLWLFQIINGENYREAFIGEMFSKNQQTGTNQDPKVSIVIVFIHFPYWSVINDAFTQHTDFFIFFLVVLKSESELHFTYLL